MAAPVEIKVDALELASVRLRLESLGKLGERAMRMAVNETLRNIRSKAREIGRERYTYYDTKRLKVRIKNAWGTETSGNITFSGKRGIGLRRFKPFPPKPPKWRDIDPKNRSPKMGISVITLKNKGRYYRFGPHGEKLWWGKAKQGARMNKWIYAIFYRDKTIVGGKSPIKMAYGPSPIQALGKEGLPKLVDYANSRLSSNLKRNLEKALRGYIR